MSALVSRMPRKALAWLVCSGEALDAASACAMGLVSRVFDAGEFEARADEAIALLASRPRIALQTVKQYLSRAPNLDPAMAAEFAGALHAMVRTK
jgi:enoyl-CoA hydratase/carnithine racemase